MSVPAMVIFHFGSALELMSEGIENDLFDPDQMEEFLEECAEECENLSHEFMWRLLKKMLNDNSWDNSLTKDNVLGFASIKNNPDVSKK